MSLGELTLYDRNLESVAVAAWIDGARSAQHERPTNRKRRTAVEIKLHAVISECDTDRARKRRLADRDAVSNGEALRVQRDAAAVSEHAAQIETAALPRHQIYHDRERSIFLARNDVAVPVAGGAIKLDGGDYS